MSTLPGGPDVPAGPTFNPGPVYIIDTARNVLAGRNPNRGPSKHQQERLAAGGYTRVVEPVRTGKGAQSRVIYTGPDGQRLSQVQARQLARAWNRAGMPTGPIRSAPVSTPVSAGWGGPSIADRLPPFPQGSQLPRIPPSLVIGAAAALLRFARGLPLAIGLWWPTAAGEGSDLRDLYPAVAAPQTRPRSRPRRRRIRTQPRPVALPRPQAPPKVAPRPGAGPVTISRPVVRPGARVLEGIVPAPKPIPAPVSVTRSSIERSLASASRAAVREISQTAAPPTVAPSAIPSWLKTVAPFLPLLSPLLPSASPASSPVARPSSLPWLNPLTQVQSNAAHYVATEAQTDPCERARTRNRKKRKKGCRNPRVSSKTYSRGGKRFQTITRRLECRASSRKKLRLPRVR